MNKRILFCVIILFALAGCATTVSDTPDVETPGTETNTPGGVVMDLPMITSLMLMEKGEALKDLGDDYVIKTLNSEKVKHYTYENQGLGVYFVDGLNPNKIDTMEFSGNVNINGVTIGMAYDEAKKMLPPDYVERPRPHDSAQTTLEFYVNDFIVRFYFNSETNSIDKVKIMRFITVEQISEMIKLDKDDFINRFGAPNIIYGVGGEATYDGHHYDLLGLTFVFGEDSPSPFNTIEYNWAEAFAWHEYRIDINGAKMWMAIDQIRDILGTPVYEGPIQFTDNIWSEYALRYQINNIQVRFSSATRDTPCREIVFSGVR